MTWLYLSILAALLWTIVNVVDKIIVSRLVPNPRIPVLTNSLVKVAVGAVIILFTRTVLTPGQLLIATLGGVAYLVGSLFYFQAMQREEASRVVPALALWIGWTPIAAALFLHEVFSMNIYVSIAAITIGSLLIMWRPRSRVPFHGKAVMLMAASTLGYAFYGIAIKYLVTFHPFWIAAAYPMLASLVISIPLAIQERKVVRVVSKKAWLVMVSNELLDDVAVLTFSRAAAMGFISLVNAALASQYIFIFLFGLVLSRWFPKIIKEDLAPRLVALKLFATLLIVGGVVWIVLN